MNTQSIIQQSQAAYNQWCGQWREHCKIHYGFKQKLISDFEFSGIGKAIVCVANGYSFEEQIETLKTYKDNVDIMACDKTLGHLLDNGIVPKYCVVCDANVNFEKYLAKYAEQLKETILFINVCANPEWSKCQWKDVYFFVNKDSINSHIEFSKLSGCMNFIAAATNVSNAMIVLLTQSDNNGRRNFFGYDKIVLVGFDYCWKFNGSYYAFDKTGSGKANYMQHCYLTLASGAPGYTSGNLVFSKDWIQTYIKQFHLPVVQTSKDSILQLGKVSSLFEQMQYSHKTIDKYKVLKMVKDLSACRQKMQELQIEINKIGKDHHWAHAATV